MKIFVCGDVMIGRGIDQILRRPVAPHIYEDCVKDARDYVTLAENVGGKIPHNVSENYVWGDALDIWNERSADFKIINLETAITANETFFHKGINYRMNPANSSVLKAAGIDVCTLANNHILDWDQKGLDDTIKSLDGIHIKHTGAALSLGDAEAPAILETDEGRVLVFSFGHMSSGIHLGWKATEQLGGVSLIDSLSNESVTEINKLIKKYIRQDDTVIVSIHWGGNWGYHVPESQINFAHALIDLGNVHIIHGHSSHHPKPIEIYKGCPIFYGCGDFINDYEGIGGHEEYRSDLTLMYFISLDTGPFKLKRIDFDCLKINHFRLQRASQEEVDWMYNTLTRECSSFALKLTRDQSSFFVNAT